MVTFSHGDAQDLLAAFKRGWERRSPDEIIELMDTDVDYRTDPFAEPLVGHNAVRELWNEYAATQAHVEFDAEHIWVNGATVLASWHAAYTRRATAERVRERGFLTMELTDGRLIRRLRQWAIERVVGTDRTFEAEPATGGDS